MFEVSFDIFPEKLNKGTYVIERIEVNVLLYYVIGIKDLGEWIQKNKTISTGSVMD